MTVKVFIIIVGLIAAIFGALKHDLAAVYVAAGVTVIIYILYTIETKIDQILAERIKEDKARA
jgi:hypothetical protein